MKVDCAWVLPWASDKAHGARSAVAGASAVLTQHGLNSIICGVSELKDINSRVYVVLGLSVGLADRIKHARPSARIFMQNHSPWLFIESSSDDWWKFVSSLAWCRKNGFAVAQIARREMESAVQAFGEDGLVFIPAVYPYDCCVQNRASSPPPDGQKFVAVMAHKDRPWKNIIGQTVAACLASRKIPLRLRVHLAEENERSCDISTICQAYGTELEIAPWLSHDAFRASVAADADIGLCCTWSECYSQAALDFMAQGVPILGSPANWFTPADWQVHPDNVVSMADKIIEILPKRDENKAAHAAALAQAEQKAILTFWMEDTFSE